MNICDPQELLSRGWRKWSNELDREGRVLLLCPLSDWKNVPNGTKMSSISGEKKIKGTDYIDDNTMNKLTMTELADIALAFGVFA